MVTGTVRTTSQPFSVLTALNDGLEMDCFIAARIYQQLTGDTAEVKNGTAKERVIGFVDLTKALFLLGEYWEYFTLNLITNIEGIYSC